VRLDRAAVRAVVAMGPSAHHLDEDTLAARTAALPDVVEATVSVTIGTYRPT
jgi:23S rRNA (guanine745-N1)-methyltransferase